MKLIHIIIIICLVISVIVIEKKRRENDDIGCRVDARRAKISVIESAVETYKQHTKQFPNKLEDMISCPTGLESVWKGPYLKISQLLDVWDRPYIYDPNGTHNKNDGYDIISYGKDGKPGGKGYNADIYND